MSKVQRTGKHDFKAELVNGSVTVKDSNNVAVDCCFGASKGNKCVTAYIKGTGYIGGWDVSTRYKRSSESFDFFNIVASINRGNILQF